MSSIRPFETCWQRIGRAQAHGNTIAKLWNAFIEDDPYDTGTYVNRDGTGGIWVEQVKAIPNDLPLEVGEYVYQLRAALDACIYEAACVNTGRRPPIDEDKLEFPFCTGRAIFNSEHIRRKMGPLTENQRFWVEEVQLYSTPKGLTDYELAFSFNRCLNILNDWARKDRHRRLHVVGSWTSNVLPLLVLPNRLLKK